MQKKITLGQFIMMKASQPNRKLQDAIIPKQLPMGSGRATDIRRTVR